MKRHIIPITMSVLILAVILPPASAFGQDIPGVTGAGTGAFPGGTSFSLVSLSGLQFGMGTFIPGDSSAAGELQVTLLGTSPLGQPQNIEVDGQANSGTLNIDGSRTFSGTATMDMGDGSPALINVPFTATATATSLLLAIENTNLPAVPLGAGTIAIQ
jgi:hypothetical protein